MSFNKITIVGNLGRDPQLRYLPSGTAVCNFSVAVNETYQDKSGALRTSPTWFRIAVFGKRADSCARYLKKGKPVYVAGRLRPREWEDDKGMSHQVLEVRATDVRFFGTEGSHSIKVS
jgi:single-strand DNA-binding protein